MWPTVNFLFRVSTRTIIEHVASKLVVEAKRSCNQQKIIYIMEKNITQNLLKLNLSVKPGATENTCLSCSYNVLLRTSLSTSDSPDAPFMPLWPNHLFQIGGRLLIFKKLSSASSFPRSHLAN